MRNRIKKQLLNEFGKTKEDFFHFGLIEQYFRKKDHSKAFCILWDKTCNDLYFDELFMFVDRTSSKVGQQYLYNKLRIIPSSAEDATYEDLINELSDNKDLRVKIQSLLHKLNTNDVYYVSSLFQDEYVKPPKWFFVTRLLSLTSIALLIMLLINTKLFLVLLSVFIVNIWFHYRNKKNLYLYLGSLPQLLKLNYVAKKLYKYSIFKQLNPSLMESSRVIDKMKNRMSFFRLEASIQGEAEMVGWAILELIKILFLFEPLLLFGILRKLDNKRKELNNIFEFVGLVDTLISIASLRNGLHNYCIPTIINKNKLTTDDVYHPLIEDCIENNISLNNRSILLTGSNMSGKTTFIRTIGINVITGLTINTCFASQFTMPRLRVLSAIRISDDLLNDRSYYFEEVLTIKEMIDKSSNDIPNLFLLDEIFKGTNTIERISAGKAVLSTLSKSKNIVFVSTHDIELTDMLSDEYQLYHFSEIVKDNNVDFDYKLKQGKLKNRNAIRILQINNYPNDLIDEAIEISEKLDKITGANTYLTNHKKTLSNYFELK